MTWQYFKNNYLFRLSNLIGRYFTWLNNQRILQHITRFTRVRFVENSWKNICWTWPWSLVQEHQKQALFGTRNVVRFPMLNFIPTKTCRSTFFCYSVSELYKLFCRHFRWSYFHINEIIYFNITLNLIIYTNSIMKTCICLQKVVEAIKWLMGFPSRNCNVASRLVHKIFTRTKKNHRVDTRLEYM